MKQADLKEKSSVFVIGKGIIVIVLSGIASLSFLLGFFVGKISHPPEMDQPSALTAGGNAEEIKPVSSEQKTLPQQADPLQHAGEMQAPHDAVQTEAANTVPAVSETQGALETKKSDETRVSDKVKKYTVQVGAFRSASDADAFRSKLDKKGYKAFLMELKAKNNEPLYRVAVGAFSTRDEAELLALRIKKSEGLKTFVTLR
jgi:cell division septation protein DedD